MSFPFLIPNALSIHATHSEWDAQSATKPLDGAYVARKPDITCYFCTLEGVSNRNWEHVVTFCKVKNRTDPKREKELFLEIAGKASCLLGAQDGRHSVSCIRFLGSSIYLTIFHCSGPISTCPFDINSSLLHFLHILIGVSLLDYSLTGFDTSIKWRRIDQTLNLEMEDSDSEHCDEAQPDSEDSRLLESESTDGQFSRSLESESTDGQFSWSLESRSADDQVPQSDGNDALQPKLVLGGTYSSGDPRQEEKSAKWLEITDMRGKHCKIWLKSVLAISDSLIGQGTTVWKGEMDTEDGDVQDVVVKDSWINPLRKYTEGMILHILEKYGVEGVPMLVSEEQVKTQLWTPDSQQPVVNSSTHFLLSVLPPNSPLHL